MCMGCLALCLYTSVILFKPVNIVRSVYHPYFPSTAHIHIRTIPPLSCKESTVVCTMEHISYPDTNGII